jgi:TetR/AcrR family transcriptional repressor of nem operon
MGRSSKAVAARHHDDLIEAASRLFRQHGTESVSLPTLMGEIGLKQGGFYKHFESKDALATAAVINAFKEHIERVGAYATRHPDDLARAKEEFLDFCLSTDHRDNPGTGCPSALAMSVARSDPDSASRGAFVDGVQQLAGEMAAQLEDDPESELEDSQLAEVLADLALSAGALMLARATAGYPLSDTILAAARRRLAR